MKTSEARPFHAVSTPKLRQSGAWGASAVAIFNGDQQIGGYERNYPSFSEETFEPFELNGSWFALYSQDYTSTRVMKLPECLDLGGEDPSPKGFCPVELFVPRYRKIVTTQLSTGRVTESRSFGRAVEKDDSRPMADYQFEYGPWRSLDVAFVAGCVWGDDSTWKLEVIDISRAAEGIISRAARFGHVQLGEMPLAKAVQLDSFPPHWDLRATIVRQERRDVRTGALIDPYDE